MFVNTKRRDTCLITVTGTRTIIKSRPSRAALSFSEWITDRNRSCSSHETSPKWRTDKHLYGRHCTSWWTWTSVNLSHLWHTLPALHYMIIKQTRLSETEIEWHTHTWHNTSFIKSYCRTNEYEQWTSNPIITSWPSYLQRFCAGENSWTTLTS